MKVAIGHSTQENPVTGVAGIKYEEQLTEPVAEIAAQILRQHGVDAVSNAPHTKAGDVASWANKVGADVFVDIHTDAANGKARGTSAFYHPGSSKGEVLAAHLYNFVGGVGGVRRSMHSRTDLIALYGTKAVSALVELEFHDRADTANFVKDNWNAYGEAVAKAVLAYLGIPFNGSGSTPPPEQPQPSPEPVSPEPVPSNRHIGETRPAPDFPLGRCSRHNRQMYYGSRSKLDHQVSGWEDTESDGTRGADGLKTFQVQMKHRGWNIDPDGLWGDQTERVVGEFQKEKGLTVDHAVGPNTWKAAWETPIS